MFDITKKEYNTYLLLNLIRDTGPVSRTRLQEITDLRPATISDITKELLDKGLIKIEGSANTGRGRNQILLKINEDHLCAIGISIEVNEITFITSTIQGKIVHKVVKDISSLSTIDQILNLIVEVVDVMIKESADRKILGVGVGDPGIVDAAGEYSIFSSQLKLWHNIPLKSILEKSLSLPVKLEVNDRLKALGEKFYGMASGIKDFVYIQLGQGIGMSIVSNGYLLRGYNGTAGEFGHTRIINNNKICMCGSYGCLETVASMGSILSQVKEAVSAGAFSYIREFSPEVGSISFDHVVKAAGMNDKVCLNIVENACIYIGTALSNVINILNPKLIILGGPMCDLGDLLLNPIRSAVYKNSLSQATADLEFKVSELREASAPLGAVTMIVDDFFKSEFVKHKSLT